MQLGYYVRIGAQGAPYRVLNRDLMRVTISCLGFMDVKIFALVLLRKQKINTVQFWNTCFLVHVDCILAAGVFCISENIGLA